MWCSVETGFSQCRIFDEEGGYCGDSSEVQCAIVSRDSLPNSVLPALRLEIVFSDSEYAHPLPVAENDTSAAQQTADSVKGNTPTHGDSGIIIPRENYPDFPSDDPMSPFPGSGTPGDSSSAATDTLGSRLEFPKIQLWAGVTSLKNIVPIKTQASLVLTIGSYRVKLPLIPEFKIRIGIHNHITTAFGGTIIFGLDAVSIGFVYQFGWDPLGHTKQVPQWGTTLVRKILF